MTRVGRAIPLDCSLAAAATPALGWSRAGAGGGSDFSSSTGHPLSMPSPPCAEKGRSPRVRRLRQARCVFNNGSSSLDVTLRNISRTGANIAGDATICLPPTSSSKSSTASPAIRPARPASSGREALWRASSSPTDGDEAGWLPETMSRLNGAGAGRMVLGISQWLRRHREAERLAQGDAGASQSTAMATMPTARLASASGT